MTQNHPPCATANPFAPHSIKTRVTLFTLSIFVVSIWALSFYASHMLKADMQRVLGEQQRSTASFIAAGINDLPIAVLDQLIVITRATYARSYAE